MKIVNVLAIITTQPGMRQKVLELVHSIEATVRAEVGCIEYQATVDLENVGPFQTEFGEDTFVVIEKWESLQALNAHAASPHMADYAAKTKGLLADRTIYVTSLHSGAVAK